ncbi:MAG TPA: hypothetical protein PLB05_06190 [Candidatus Omnitrophota bacterium]|nr:hypothetical protein [Candidatus Omnitrophota bacterium]HPN56525.1 hypothetical protein [Candidatus Omnitrophota bacterium]
MVEIVKFIVAVFLLPVVVAVMQGLGEELAGHGAMRDIFLWGVLSYTLWHLFVFSFARLFEFFQKILADIFRFSLLAQSVMPRVIPWGTTFLLLVYFIVTHLFRLKGAEPIVYFLTGFSLALHVILIAAELYQEDPLFLKPHYFFFICLTFIGNVLVVALLLDLNFEKFSFLSFWKHTAGYTVSLYKYLFNKFVF